MELLVMNATGLLVSLLLRGLHIIENNEAH